MKISSYSCIVKNQQIIISPRFKTVKCSVLFILLVFQTQIVSAQFKVVNDLAYTFKDSCVKFSPINNDSLIQVLNYNGVVAKVANNGSFKIDSFYPYYSTYCPNPGFKGKDTMKYSMCNKFTSICKEAFIFIVVDSMTAFNSSWAGDLNNDGKVSSLDYLFMANAIHSQGKEIPGRDSSWKRRYAENWNESLWGVDMKYIDADGNGVIDTSDLFIVNQNIFNSRTILKTPFNSSGYERNKSIKIHTKMSKKNFVIGDTLSVDVFFGDSLGLAVNDRDITGAAFVLTLNEDISTQLKNAKAWFSTYNNWITTGYSSEINIIKRRTDKFGFEVALSRPNHLSNDKNQNAACNNLKLKLTSRDKLSNNIYADVYSSVTGGTPPFNYFWKSGSNSANLSGINNVFPSSHSLVLIDAAGCKVNTDVVLYDRSAGGKGFLGTLKVIIEDDIMQLSNNINKNIEFVLEDVYMIDDQEPEFMIVETHHDKLKSFVNTVSGGGNEMKYIIYAIDNSNYRIQFQEQETIKEIKIYDAIGKEILMPIKMYDHKVDIETGANATALYIIKIKTNSNVFTLKLNQ